uniref:UPAR/Ly6 domain-containing protein n=1 Tax=Oryzias melastigma TaxID=30732 RepID=A0A3B3DHZ7_ORYME
MVYLCLWLLRCNFCPLLEKSESCPYFTTECPPGEYCTSSRGFYGALHVLSAQGCVRADLCGSSEMVTYRGVQYKVRYACCCQNECNELSPGRICGASSAYRLTQHSIAPLIQ